MTEAIVRIRTPAKVTSIPLLAANPDSDLGRSDRVEAISGGVRSRPTYARRSARWHARDSQSIDIGCGGEDMDGREALAGQSIGRQDSRQSPQVAVDDRLIDDPAGSSGVPGDNDRGRDGEDDGDGWQLRGGRSREERPPRAALDVGCVDDDKPAHRKPVLQLSMEDRKRQPRHPLVRGIARHRLAIRVRREDLGWGEEAGSQRRLAGTGGSDQDDE